MSPFEIFFKNFFLSIKTFFLLHDRYLTFGLILALIPIPFSGLIAFLIALIGAIFQIQKKFINNEDEVVAASDAFFPFVDGIEKLVQSGVTAVIQPSGSIRDKEIINFANETDTILVFSKTRHFRH